MPLITPKDISNYMRDIAYDAYWNQKPNSGFREVIAAVINNWPNAKWYEIQVPDDTSDDIRYVTKKTGILLPWTHVNE